MAEGKDLLIACHIRTLHDQLTIQSTDTTQSMRNLILYNDLSPKLEKEFKLYFNLKSIDYIDSDLNMKDMNKEQIKEGFDIGSDANFDFGWSGQFKYPDLHKNYDFIIPVRCPIFMLIDFYMQQSGIQYKDAIKDELKDIGKAEKLLFFYLNHLKIGGKLIIYCPDRYTPNDGIINDKFKMTNVNITYFKGKHTGFPRAIDINLYEIKDYLNSNGISFYLDIPKFNTQSVIIIERTSDSPITYLNGTYEYMIPEQTGGRIHRKLTNNYNKQNHNSNNNNHNNHNNKKTKKNIFQRGGGGNAPMDLQALTQADVDALMQQGIMPEQIADLAQQQGQPIPPIVLQMLSQAPQGQAMALQGQDMMQQGQAMAPQGPDMSGMPAQAPPDKTSKFPAMMDLPTYAQYKEVEKKQEKEKLKFGAHKPQVFGYVFSDLISEDILRDMRRTQGSFLVGVNLNNLFNVFKETLKAGDKGEKLPKLTNSDEIYKRVGEYVNVDFEKILDKKMGYRGSDVPLLPENELNEYSSFYEVINESKKYADMGLNGKITPYGLLIMTRMLYKYRKNNAQWVRVATVLELIYKYLSKNQNRAEFFKNKVEIPIISLMDLEEFYNTDHIFMTEDELQKFKKDLDFYKFDQKMNIAKMIRDLQSKAPPII